MFGKFVEHGSWRLEAPVRLFRRGQVHWPATIHRGPTIQGSVGRLSHPFIHVAHTTVARFVEKLNRYTDIEAEALFESGARSNLALACLGALRAFLGQYVRLQGYRDGGHGLVLAVLMAFYYFSTRAKLWTLWYMSQHAQEP
jgi:hypothetical protein